MMAEQTTAGFDRDARPINQARFLAGDDRIGAGAELPEYRVYRD